MEYLAFALNSLALGLGLAMDAFSVSVATGAAVAKDADLFKRSLATSLVFSLFQGIMPLAGWLVLHAASSRLTALAANLPFISAIFLSAIGIKMIFDGASQKESEGSFESLSARGLIALGFATSLDALSAGLGIAERNISEALFSAAVISAVTFLLCFIGTNLGEKISKLLPCPPEFFGGAILILLGAKELIFYLL